LNDDLDARPASGLRALAPAAGAVPSARVKKRLLVPHRLCLRMHIKEAHAPAAKVRRAHRAAPELGLPIWRKATTRELSCRQATLHAGEGGGGRSAMLQVRVWGEGQRARRAIVLLRSDAA